MKASPQSISQFERAHTEASCLANDLDALQAIVKKEATVFETVDLDIMLKTIKNRIKNIEHSLEKGKRIF